MGLDEGRAPEDGEEAAHDPLRFEAAVWVARLASADATDDDRAAFAVWRAADPAHAEAYAELEDWHRTMGRAPVPRERRRKRGKGPASLAVALSLSALAAYEMGLLDRWRADLWTGVGSIETTVLADGSRIDLDTDTAVALRFTASERGVELLRGEAVFDVVPDPGRPFVVHGPGLTVRAVGTRFFVRADRDPVPVGVAEGRVNATVEGRGTVIGAGEVLHRAPEDRLRVERADVERSIAWREGRLVVAGQPLSTILAELNRYRHGRIVLLDAAQGARQFTGTLDVRDTDDALAVLAASMRLKIIRVTPLLVLVRAAS